MLNKVNIDLLRPGDVVRLEELESAETWFVEEVNESQVILQIANYFYNKTKLLRKNPRRKKYVYVEVE